MNIWNVYKKKKLKLTGIKKTLRLEPTRIKPINTHV